MSNATDRFPAFLITSNLVPLLGNKSSSFCKLYQWFPYAFSHKRNNKISNDFAYYNTGTGMGTYGSWASFAYTNHLLVFCICQELGLKYKEVKYFLLGDDIVIIHDDVATRYIELIKVLGVDYSAFKTHTSYHFLEFAKRLIFKREQVTPFPIGALVASKGNFINLVNVFIDAHMKGYISPCIESFLNDYIKVYTPYSKPLIKTEFKEICNSLLGLTTYYDNKRGIIPNDALILDLCTKYNFSYYFISKLDIADLLLKVKSYSFYEHIQGSLRNCSSVIKEFFNYLYENYAIDFLH